MFNNGETVKEKEEICYCPRCNEIKAKDRIIGGKFRIIDSSDWAWKVLENRATAERRKGAMDFISKYGPIIGLALVSVVFMIVVYFSYNYLSDIAGKCFAQAPGAIDATKATAPNVPVIGNLINPNPTP